MSVPLVLIEWEDSAQPIPSWKWLEDFKPSGIVLVSSVGWLVHDGADIKVLAPNMGISGDDDVQISGAIQIPTRCVVRRVELKEPKRA